MRKETGSEHTRGNTISSRDTPPNFMFRAIQSRTLHDLDVAPHPQKLLAITAPVGYGKTVLMSSLFHSSMESGRHCYWLALDDRDSGISHVLGLLEELFMGQSERLGPTKALFIGDTPQERRIQRLLNAIAGIDEHFTLFIDNLNHCTDPQLGRLLDKLIFDTPPTACFVLSSTTEPPVNLVRAKLEGLVRQVGYAELRFTSTEVKELLGPNLSNRIGTAGIDAITRQTEGWPAAVRMAQIILSGSADPLAELQRFSASNEDLAHLLNRQVLSGFEDSVRAFLFDIAPLRRFTIDLCRYATGSEDAARHLDFLLRKNVFIIPLDYNRTWYRLHLFFKQYLEEEAKNVRSLPHRQSTLLRAAQWCERNDLIEDAIEYALMANADDFAAQIIERTADRLVRDRGDLHRYSRWIEQLLRLGQRLGWEAEYWYTWSLVLHRRYNDGRNYLTRLATSLEKTPPKNVTKEQLHDLHRRLDITRVCLNIFSDRLKEAHGDAKHWIVGIGPDDNPFDVTAVYCTESVFYSSAFLFTEAREAAQAAQISAYQTDSMYANGWVAALSALPAVLEGNFAQIQPELAGSLSLLRGALGNDAAIVGTLSLLIAACSVEMGNYSDARKYLADHLSASKKHGVVDVVACGLDAAVKAWTGPEDDSITITELRAVANAYSPRASSMLSCFLVRRLIRLGRLDEAQTEASRIGLSVDRPVLIPESAKEIARTRDAYFAAAIDLYIAFGNSKAAENLIPREVRTARNEGRIARLVELALSEADIAMCQGSRSLAHRSLTRAIALASTRAIVRPFDDHRTLFASLVEETKPTAWGFALSQERKFFADLCDRLAVNAGKKCDSESQLMLEAGIVEPLTKRQLELLRLLEAGLSNQHIADRINVSLTTVKGHLQKLFSKLNVRSRSAALARARALNLL